MGWRRCAVVALLAAAVHLNGLDGDFVFDDTVAIVSNEDVVGPQPTSVRDIFAHDFWGKNISSSWSHKSYRPLTVMTFRANFLLGGMDTFWYHAFNVVLHAAAAAAATAVVEGPLGLPENVAEGARGGLHIGRSPARPAARPPPTAHRRSQPREPCGRRTRCT